MSKKDPRQRRTRARRRHPRVDGTSKIGTKLEKGKGKEKAVPHARKQKKTTKKGRRRQRGRSRRNLSSISLKGKKVSCGDGGGKEKKGVGHIREDRMKLILRTKKRPPGEIEKKKGGKKLL